MAGSTTEAGGLTTPSAASDNVTLWPMVNDVTISPSRANEPPRRISPTRNRMWSGPIAMWWIPAGTNVASTAATPGQGAGVAVHRGAADVEDRLVPQRPVLVDVHEGLVLAVVWE
jgi:hypothetical protein